MPFKIGPAALIIITAIFVLIFGTRRLPQIGNSMGKAMRSFHRGLSGSGQEAVTGRKE